MVQQGFLRGTSMAFLGLDQLRILKPVCEGDTIHVNMEIALKKDSRNRPNSGIVTIRHFVLNQRDEPVMRFDRTIMVRRRSALE